MGSVQRLTFADCTEGSFAEGVCAVVDGSHGVCRVFWTGSMLPCTGSFGFRADPDFEGCKTEGEECEISSSGFKPTINKERKEI